MYKCLFAGFLLCLTMVCATDRPMAAAPGTMNFQGKLTNTAGQVLADGSYSIRVTLYNTPTAGIAIWAETLSVAIAGGLLNARLGEIHPLDPSFFSSPTRWVGIAVGANDELSPRVPLSSVPYALSTAGGPYLPLAGGTMTGPTLHDTASSLWQENGHDRIVITPTGDGYGGGGAQVSTFGFDDQEQFRLWGGGWGELLLFDGQPANTNSVTLSAGYSGGGSLTLTDGSGTTSIWMNGGIKSDASIQLPDSAIDAREILDEPGIAQAWHGDPVDFNMSSMTDIVTVSITTPAAGYVVLDGSCTGTCVGLAGNNVGEIQIDETAGGTDTWPYYVRYGSTSFPNTGASYYPVYRSRVYFKPAGTYTFRLEGMVSGNPGALGGAMDGSLRATYVPTSYGTVSAFVSSSEISQFQSAQKRYSGSTVAGVAQPSHDVYQIDLRELEVKASKAQAEAERLQRELLAARMRQPTQARSRGDR